MRASFELLCFDLDGTLVDSAPDLNFSLGEALAAVGLPGPSEAQTRGWIGDGIDNLLRRALQHTGSESPEVFTAALASFHESYAENLFRRSRLYPGAQTVLHSLRDAGLRMCCITNKRSDYAARLLDLAGISHLFEFTYGGDSFAEKKPHPRQLLEGALLANVAAQRCVMIGDSDTDAGAAQAAGFAFIWASFGYCPRLVSRDVATVARADRFTDVPAALRSVMP